MEPYIGITDFDSGERSKEIADFFQETQERLDPDVERQLMVGVMMSYKTLHDLPTKWASVWPRKEEVAGIFRFHPKVLNTLHYADYDGMTMLEDLQRVVELGGAYIEALQLDMIWPDPDMVFRLKRIYRTRIDIILQVGGKALDAKGNDPEIVGDAIAEYVEMDNCISGVLLDKSMGQGRGMDAEALAPFAAKIDSAFPGLVLGVAGGLGPGTMQLAEPLARSFREVAIDAQGQLRDSGSSLDPINWDRAKVYLTRALEMFSGS